MLQTQALTVSRKDAAKCWNAFGAIRRIMYVQNVERHSVYFHVNYGFRFTAAMHTFSFTDRGTGISYTLFLLSLYMIIHNFSVRIKRQIK